MNREKKNSYCISNPPVCWIHAEAPPWKAGHTECSSRPSDPGPLIEIALHANRNWKFRREDPLLSILLRMSPTQARTPLVKIIFVLEEQYRSSNHLYEDNGIKWRDYSEHKDMHAYCSPCSVLVAPVASIITLNQRRKPLKGSLEPYVAQLGLAWRNRLSCLVSAGPVAG